MKKFLSNPITLAFLSCLVLTPIGNHIYENTKTVPILTTFILKPLSLVWNVILSMLTFKISIGVILITIGLLTRVRFLVKKYVTKKKVVENKAEENPLVTNDPSYLDFKQGVIKKWRWAWDYRFNQRINRYQIEDLTPYCPSCDIRMLSDSSKSVYTCPNCHKYYNIYANRDEDPTKIEALILDRIEKGKY